jgi:hypothetical protein
MWHPTIFVTDGSVQKLLQPTLITVHERISRHLSKYRGCGTSTSTGLNDVKLNVFVKVNCTTLKSNVLCTSTKIPK